MNHNNNSIFASLLVAGVIGISGCSDDANKVKEPLSAQAQIPVDATSAPNEPSEASMPKPKLQNRQVLIGKAWQTLGDKNYEGSIAAADECIARFEAQALAAEELLFKDNITTPVGAVTAEQRKAIQSNGPLNDVAVSYYIKGMALGSLSKKSEARAAFINAAKFRHARIWDPKKKQFWAPADELPTEIEKLK